ncbi:Tetratricopeptide-like helical domain containing protein [Parasponia andersonii]|uniref:Tetratricopeptide-like helical domain containing protein n=1 Tax=Parasponia andersonii TaxID=3476 RepID=A0A2P5A8G4_PARAD|nr:Tetratricopeptide-like helical domain containing protein [Parasponia andersonii]
MRLRSFGEMGTNVFNQNLKITQLGKSGRIEEAIKIFSQMTKKNTVTYNSMVSAYAKNGRIRDARHLDLFSWTLMITCYTRNGELQKARELFNLLPDKQDSVCWNAMIAGYAKKGLYEEAKKLFYEMPVKNLVSWNSMLAGYTKNGEMHIGLQFFEEMAERDVVSWNLIVDGFVEVGDLDSAWKFFKKIPEPNVVSWVTMLCGFARNGRIVEAQDLFEQMPIRNVVSWNAMLAAYVQDSQIDRAVRLFSEMPERDAVSWTTMINGYVCVGKLDEARQLLHRMPYKNIAAQTAMISGYVQSKRMDEASQIFNQIGTRDVVCWNTMIAGYAQCGRMAEAQFLFNLMTNKDLVSWNTMITGYAQAGQMDKALEIFDVMGKRNIVSWNSMIAGFLQNGLYLDALKMFLMMRKEGRRPDQSTFSCGLSACANLAALQVGEQLHHLILKSGYVNDLFVSNALITMYAKSGRVFNAELVFRDIGNVDIVSWNSLIAGYALNGYGKEAVELLEEMLIEGVAPDQVTFVGVLSACSHTGLVAQGLKLFKNMTQIHKIEPLPEHYACLVDLLGRAGRLEEALKLVLEKKVKATAGLYGALLGASRIHRNLELGKYATEKLLELEPHKASNYVLLSNIHAEAGRWSEVERIRVLMSERIAAKQPGCSWIELGNQVHSFLSDDAAQPRIAEVCSIPKTLTAELNCRTCVSDMKSSLLDIL